MQLIHIERATAASDDRRLLLILEARQRAAERCMEANQHATDVRCDLIQHLSRRLQAGAEWLALRRVLIAGGMAETTASKLLRASAGSVPALPGVPGQQELPYGQP